MTRDEWLKLWMHIKQIEAYALSLKQQPGSIVRATRILDEVEKMKTQVQGRWNDIPRKIQP